MRISSSVFIAFVLFDCLFVFLSGFVHTFVPCYFYDNASDFDAGNLNLSKKFIIFRVIGP